MCCMRRLAASITRRLQHSQGSRPTRATPQLKCALGRLVAAHNLMMTMRRTGLGGAGREQQHLGSCPAPGQWGKCGTPSVPLEPAGVCLG